MLIEFKDIEFCQGNFTLKADLALPKGKMICFLGPSGSGKTTLLRLLAGFLSAQRGTIHLEDRDISKTPSWERNLGYLFQDLALFPHMKVKDNIAFGLKMQGKGKEFRDQQIKKMLNLVGLQGYENRMIHQLSGGEQQRVALARALAPEPQCLMLDEPLSALDAAVREKLGRHIRKIQQEDNLTTLFVTHDQEEAMKLSDWIYVMRDGEIMEGGSPEDVYLRPRHEWTAQFLGDGIILPIVWEDHQRFRSPWGIHLGDDFSGKEKWMLIRPQWINLGKGDKKCRLISKEFGPKGYRLEMEYGGETFILFKNNLPQGETTFSIDRFHLMY